MVVLFCAPFVARKATAEPLTPQELSGKRIYITGEEILNEEIIALLGDASIPVAASILPCINCHGHNGEGKSEGGIEPSNITWRALIKPYGIKHSSGREHPPYTPGSIIRAITQGIDPAGNVLSKTMPRYQFSEQQSKHVIAYLRRLGNEIDAGIGTRELTLALLLPTKGPLQERARVIAAVVAAFFRDINHNGGIYGRKLILKTIDIDQFIGITDEDIARRFSEGEIFAVVAALVANQNSQIINRIGAQGIPIIAPITLNTMQDTVSNRYIFQLFADSMLQAHALTLYVAENIKLNRPHAVIISVKDPAYSSVVDAIKERASQLEWPSVELIEYSQDQFSAKRLRDNIMSRGLDPVFYLGPGNHAIALLKSFDTAKLNKTVLLVGSLVGRDVFSQLNNTYSKVFLSFPMLPPHSSLPSAQSYRDFIDKHGLRSKFSATQIASYSAVKILLEGLKQSGRKLSRETLVDVLENLHEFETGVIPPITYSITRRKGISGAYIVSLDMQQQTFISVQ